MELTSGPKISSAWKQKHPPHVDNMENWLSRPFKPPKRAKQGLMQAGDNLKRFIAGAASAAVSKSCVAPFERVRMDIILGNSTLGAAGTALGVWRQEGFTGFWRGNGLNIFRNAPFKAVNYLTYDLFHKFLRPEGASGPGPCEKFAAGAMAGAAGVLTCFPLDTIRTRLLAANRGRYKGIIDCFTTMVQKEGVGSLYRGVPLSLLSIVPSSAIFYGVYNLLKQKCINESAGGGKSRQDVPEHWKTGGNKRLNPAQSLLYGAVAGCCAEATVYPLEVVRRQLQLQSISASTCGCSHHVQSQLNGIVTVCMRISSQQGLGGFYSGILVNTIQVLPNAALSYVAYETLKSALNVPQDEGYT